MTGEAYYPSPWPGEDGGPARLSTPLSGSGLNIQPGEKLKAIVRKIHMGTMTVLGDPGEVFLLTHTMVRSKFGLPTTCCVERVDFQNLKTIYKSPRLPGGPAWPGGIAVHLNGDLYVVYGRYAHRLNRSCELVASFQLPINRPHNSFVILDNGLLVTKDISDVGHSTLSVIDTSAMQAASPPTICPEPSIARLSAVGNTVYVIGVKTAIRYHWNDASGLLKFLDTGCVACHSGTLLGGSTYQKVGAVKPWPNQTDLGRAALTKNDADKFIFKVPSLRNVARTAPYFHDGSTEKLPDAVKLMASHQLGRDLADADAQSIATFLDSLTGDIPKEFIQEPQLPPSGKTTPKPDPT